MLWRVDAQVDGRDRTQHDGQRAFGVAGCVDMDAGANKLVHYAMHA